MGEVRFERSAHELSEGLLRRELGSFRVGPQVCHERVCAECFGQNRGRGVGVVRGGVAHSGETSDRLRQ